MAAPVVIFNSVNWNTTYDFTISDGGLLGLFDMPPARDDGLHWIPGNNTPVSEGQDTGFRRIIVNGVITKASEALLHAELVGFTNAINALKEAGDFKTLKFWSSYTTNWDALPEDIVISFFGRTEGATSARVTVIFNAITDSLDVP